MLSFNFLVGRSVSSPLKLSKPSVEASKSNGHRPASKAPALSLLLRSTGALKSSAAQNYISLDSSVYRGIASGLQIELCASFAEKDTLFSVVDDIAALSQDFSEKASEPELVSATALPTQTFSWGDDTEDSNWDTDNFFSDWSTPSPCALSESSTVAVVQQSEFTSQTDSETLEPLIAEEEQDDRFVDISIYRRPSRPNWSFPQFCSNIRHRDEMRKYAICNNSFYCRRERKQHPADR